MNYIYVVLSKKCSDPELSVIVELQKKEFAVQIRELSAAKHQCRLDTSYFEQIGQVCTRSTILVQWKVQLVDGSINVG